MNDLENYKMIVEQHFGANSCTLDINRPVTNSVIGALNHTQFGPFTSCFQKRLERLSKVYKTSNANRKDLMHMVKQVADERNWEGAYAELVAYDFLNSDTNLLSSAISLQKTVPASDTIAGNLGYQNVNYDGYYDDFGVYFDVKILSDKAGSILKGIISDVQKKLGSSNFTIAPEYPLDIDFELFQKYRSKLVDELGGSIDMNERNTLVSSEVIPELSYRILWGSGVLMAESPYNPYLHAKNHHALLFKHAKKFSRIRPSLIIFVIFPWFSESVTGLERANETFYRSFCRRFFCQYARGAIKAKQMLGRFNGEDSAFDITKKLSGVIFLEDRSITANSPAQQNVEAYAYLNPNSENKLGNGFRDHLLNFHFSIDNFEYDNY